MFVVILINYYKCWALFLFCIHKEEAIVNMERQRKLKARALRQESLANAFTKQEPTPIIVKKNVQTEKGVPAIATEQKKIKKIVAIETKRGTKVSPKSNKHLKVKQTSKGGRNSK